MPDPCTTTNQNHSRSVRRDQSSASVSKRGWENHDTFGSVLRVVYTVQAHMAPPLQQRPGAGQLTRQSGEPLHAHMQLARLEGVYHLLLNCLADVFQEVEGNIIEERTIGQLRRVAVRSAGGARKARSGWQWEGARRRVPSSGSACCLLWGLFQAGDDWPCAQKIWPAALPRETQSEGVD